MVLVKQMSRRKAVIIIGLVLLTMCFCVGCGAESDADVVDTADIPAATLNRGSESEKDMPVTKLSDEVVDGDKEEEVMNEIRLFVGEKELAVQWEENESVDALRELIEEQSLSIQMSMYGGFEQVGAIGTSLPRSDVQTTTGAGDIVLYSGNQIVMFYGSNSWAYTRLGRITGMSADELAELLGHGDVRITLSMP